MAVSVSVEFVRADTDSVLAEHFTDEEQFIKFSRDQDFDIETCLELCDTVEVLNGSIRETRMDMLSAQYDYLTQVQRYESLPSVERVEAMVHTKEETN